MPVFRAHRRHRARSWSSSSRIRTRSGQTPASPMSRAAAWTPWGPPPITNQSSINAAPSTEATGSRLGATNRRRHERSRLLFGQEARVEFGTEEVRIQLEAAERDLLPTIPEPGMPSFKEPTTRADSHVGHVEALLAGPPSPRGEDAMDRSEHTSTRSTDRFDGRARRCLLPRTMSEGGSIQAPNRSGSKGRERL